MPDELTTEIGATASWTPGKFPTRNPKLKPKEMYAMRAKKTGLYVRNPVMVQDPAQARLWTGTYLNSCAWDWSISCDAVTQKEILVLIGKKNKTPPPKPKPPTRTTHRSISEMAKSKTKKKK